VIVAEMGEAARVGVSGWEVVFPQALNHVPVMIVSKIKYMGIIFRLLYNIIAPIITSMGIFLHPYPGFIFEGSGWQL
jgi:hypothetical protein